MPSRAQLANLGRALLAACDAKDGLADGVISHPSACQFDPAVVQCQGAEGHDCLTPAQVANTRSWKEFAPLRKRASAKRA